MKTIAVFVALVAVTLAAPQGLKQEQAYIVKETPSNNIGVDGYQFGYEQSDHQTRQESAQVQLGRTAEEATLRVTGSYSFGTDGQTYTVTYVADENGFQPQGAHLPVGPQ